MTGPGPQPAPARSAVADPLADEPAVQDVTPADAVRVARLAIDALVVDGSPRYHLADCAHLVDDDPEPLSVAEAVEVSFTPCARWVPDIVLLADVRPS